MISNFEKVIEFNTTFGLPHYDIPQENVFNQNAKLAELRYSLIHEEVNELNDAFNDHNFIEVIDALTDILYVIYGAASSFGFNITNTYFKRHENKNEKVSIFENCREDTDRIDKDDIKTFYECPIGQQYLTIIKTLLGQLNLAKLNGEYLNTVNILTEMLDFTYRLGSYFDIDLNKSFDIVHSSNMSKVCKNETEAQETVEWYKQNETRYDSPSYKLADDDETRYIVYNKSTGKILKNINYVAAKFDSMITNI